MAGRGSLLSSSLRRLTTSIPLTRSTVTPWYPRGSTLKPLVPSRPLVRLQSQWGRPQYQRFNRAQQVYGLWNQSPAFRAAIGITVVGGGAFYYVNLETVPISGRRRFNCISPETEQSMSDQQVGQVLKQYQGHILPPNHPAAVLCQRVLDRLIQAAGLEGNQWDLRVIDDPKMVNAFVVPGGKVFVFTGILPICAGEDGVAAVLGHELAHNVAHHVAERMSQMWFVLAAAFLLSYTLDISGQLASVAVDLALSKPNSRKMESEADHIGLMLMAQACYDPAAVPKFWQRMAKAEQYAPPQLLSTHPGSASRVKAIEGWIPEAESKRAEGDCGLVANYGIFARPYSTKLLTLEIAPQFRQTFRRAGEDFF